MVSFVCDACQTTLKKKKAETHRCSGSRTFSCIGCGGTFDYNTIRNHVQCITEAEKVQGSLFKGTRLKNAAANGELVPQNSRLGEKRGRSTTTDESETKSSQTKKVATTATWEENDLSKSIMKLVEKKPLMMNKLRKKLNKSVDRTVSDSDFVEALTQLGSYVTISKTVVAAEDDD